MTTAEILRRLPGLSALVIGDICLDRWCTYEPKEAEPSRETGIPRIAVVSHTATPGAAGTVANNLVALGLKQVDVLGAVGLDGYGHDLLQVLSEREIGSDLIIQSSAIRTFTYTKLINSETRTEDQARVDFINRVPLPTEIEEELASRVEEYAPKFDVVLVSDQAETEAGGAVTARVRDALAHIAAADPDRVVWVDSRRRIERFHGLSLKVNDDEADAACERIGCPGNHEALRRLTGARHLVVTCGREGAIVVKPSGAEIVPARDVGKPVDICGAGDSFSAGAATTLAITGDPLVAAAFGNLVASITIMQRGTGTASSEQVLAAAG
jgi:rfaE bifunctional protein kinase chain/domain